MIRRSNSDRLPSALERLDDLTNPGGGKRFAVFLDYDGTLTPIAARPDLAVLSNTMRATVGHLAACCPVAIISGRDLPDMAGLVGLDSVYYAGSHGFDISGPGGCRMRHDGGLAAEPSLRAAERDLRAQLAGVPGALIEGKAFAVAAHYRLASEEVGLRIKKAVDAVAAKYPALRVTAGKKIAELRPRAEWDKGRAVLWLLRALKLDLDDACSIYIGDDATDEDAFEVLADRGVGILVRDGPRETEARYALEGPAEVQTFLEALASAIERRTQ